MKEREHKSFTFQVKAIDDDKGLIEAYGSVFDVVDDGDGYMRDVVRKGAFTRTIKNNKSRIEAGKAFFLATMLWSHDTQNHLPIGGWYDLQEDTNGLLGKGQIVLETQLGREVYSLIKAKVINQFSIGYDVPSGGSSYDSKNGIRELTELRLWEISPVVFAMNQEALLVGVKSQEKRKAAMDKKTQKSTKTFEEHEQEEQAEDLLEDWQDVYISALTDAVFDAIKIGDNPAGDISAAIDAFKSSVLEKWVAQAVQYGLSDYISDEGEWSAQYDLQYGSESKPNYGYMSRRSRLSRKAGRAISATNQSAIDDHVANLHDIADKAMKDMKSSLKVVHTAADDFASTMQGAESAYGTDPGNPGEGQQEGKSHSSEQEIGSTLSALRTLRTATI